MKLIIDKDIKYFQSNLLRENNFKHAFFTKRYKGNEPIKLQHELNLSRDEATN